MDNKSSNYKTTKIELLGSNQSYFRYIFKKTEKIVSSVFYITHNLKDTITDSVVIKDLEETALSLLEVVHTSLTASEENAEYEIKQLQYALIKLESKLRILQAVGALSTDLLDVFVNEIDSVARTSRGYGKARTNPLLSDSEGDDAVQEVRKGRIQKVKGDSVDDTEIVRSQSSVRQLPNRRGRILNVLREKGQSQIKDIVEIVKDCSEKTIQRELNAMIKDGIIVREGARRWSKYSILS